jgi:NADPH-dependent glutamate synthase beta subunit-like oxidoreductase/CO/xanthine dehydrogenase FAD-binding subunit
MMTLRSFKHLQATSLDQAVAISEVQEERNVVMAGGTDLLGALKDNIYAKYPESVVDLKKIPNLAYVREDDKNLRIGSLTKLIEVEENDVVKQKYGLLAEATRSVASPQIRNMGTVGGNICQQPRCWYFRYPENFFNCLRKGGKRCNAIVGENQYHSIFGAARVGMTQCASNCPGEVQVPSYLAKIREGKLAEAAQMLLDRNPIPAITGRVCPHFCELACNRGEFDEPVAVREIERFMGDYILAKSDEIIRPPAKETGKSVAIIGSGPGGLSAAYYLRKMGHKVTVFEKMEEAGGMLSYCIPANRLARTVIREQIEALQNMGIKFKLGIDVGSGVTFEKIRKEHDSVFLATGAWSQRKLGIEKEELLISGLDFLTKVSLGNRKPPGTKVLVIGGGNVAVDVAVTALRLGSKSVTMVCLESREEMPAFAEDIEGAVDDGVSLLTSWGPNRLLETAGKISGVEFVRCSSVFDRDGHFHPTYDNSVTKIVEADQVILAIGQAPDFSYSGKAISDSHGLMSINKKTQSTSVPGVFAGGDMTTGTASIIEAVAAGRRAAVSINSYLGGDRANDETHFHTPRTLLDLDSKSLVKTQRIRISKLPQSGKSVDREDTQSLDLDKADKEANRCLNCGCVAVNASDIAPALVALAAKIKTTRRTLIAEDFFDAAPLNSTILDEGELVTEIEIPTPSPMTRQTYLKFRVRNSIDFPIVSVAAAITIVENKVTDARIALGAVAPIPIRANDVEDFLKGKVPTEEVAEAEGTLAAKEANPLSKNKYKVQIVKTLVKRAILTCARSKQ